MAALTLTIPATNAPQLNVPISFGIEINLQFRKNSNQNHQLGFDIKPKIQLVATVALRMSI